MTDKKNPGETLTVTPTKTLTLKRPGVEQGMVRQSFSHGRTKAVVVEKVKRRVVGPGEGKAEPAPAAAPAAPPVRRTPISGRATPAVASPATAPAAPGGKPSGVVLRTLTEEERSARAHALADAKVREAEERRQVGSRVLVHDRRPGFLEAPQVDGNAGKGQAMVGNLLLEFLPIRLGRVRHRSRVRAEAAELDALVPKVLQLVQDFMEIGCRLGLIEDVRPAADGEFLFHGYLLVMMSW